MAVEDALAGDFSFCGSLRQRTAGRDGWRGYRDEVRRAAPDFDNKIIELARALTTAGLPARSAQTRVSGSPLLRRVSPGVQRPRRHPPQPSDIAGMSGSVRQLLRLPDAPLHGTLYLPKGRTPGLAVVVIGGSGGSEPAYLAQPLAAAGFAALSLAYFARPGLPDQLREIPLEYFRGALRLLTEALAPARVPAVVLGMSRGSEAALLSAIHFRDLVDGVVVTVPSNLVMDSSPPGDPAWLLDGQPLPYVEQPGPTCDNPDAVIPAELVRGPILMISAGQDQVWPSAAMARAISGRLTAAGHTFGHLLLQYPAADHSLGYLVPSLPLGLLPAGVTNRPADQAARADAWPQTLQFLRQLRDGDAVQAR